MRRERRTSTQGRRSDSVELDLGARSSQGYGRQAANPSGPRQPPCQRVQILVQVIHPVTISALPRDVFIAVTVVGQCAGATLHTARRTIQTIWGGIREPPTRLRVGETEGTSLRHRQSVRG